MGNFELKSYAKGLEFLFLIKIPTLSSCAPSGITLLAHYKMAAYSVRTRQVSGDHDLVLQAMPLNFFFIEVISRLFSSFLIL